MNKSEESVQVNMGPELAVSCWRLAWACWEESPGYDALDQAWSEHAQNDVHMRNAYTRECSSDLNLFIWPCVLFIVH